MKRFFRALVYAILMALPGCATTAVQPTVVAYPKVAVPIVQPIATAPVSVKIMADGSADIDETSYQNLQINLLDIQRWISQEKAVVTLLEKVLDERSQPTTAK